MSLRDIAGLDVDVDVDVIKFEFVTSFKCHKFKRVEITGK